MTGQPGPLRQHHGPQLHRNGRRLWYERRRRAAAHVLDPGVRPAQVSDAFEVARHRAPLANSRGRRPNFRTQCATVSIWRLPANDTGAAYVALVFGAGLLLGCIGVPFLVSRSAPGRARRRAGGNADPVHRHGVRGALRRALVHSYTRTLLFALLPMVAGSDAAKPCQHSCRWLLL